MFTEQQVIFYVLTCYVAGMFTGILLVYLIAKGIEHYGQDKSNN